MSELPLHPVTAVCCTCGKLWRYNVFAPLPIGKRTGWCDHVNPGTFTRPISFCPGSTYIVGDSGKYTDEEARAIVALITSAGSDG